MGLEGILTPILLYHTLFNVSKSCVRTAVNLSFKIVGESTTETEEPPILMLHGLLSSKSNWKGIAKTILNMTKRTVVRVDLRNHGGSPHVNSNKYEDMAEDLIQLLDKLEISKASLVGHNMGGRVAMCVSLIAPSRVAGLLLVDISPFSTAIQFKEMLKFLTIMKNIDFTKSKKLCRARKDLKRQIRDHVPDDTTLYTLLSNVRFKRNGKIGLRCNVDVLLKHFHHITSFPKELKRGKKYEGPCLFIGGQLSDYIPPDDLTKIRELFPQAVITYIPKTGHNLHEEDPKSFLELTIGFLKTNH